VPVVEFSHPDALKQLTNADWVPQTMVCQAKREQDGLTILVQYPFMYRDTRVNYLTSNRPVSSFECDRRRFLDDNECGTWARPLSLQQTELDNGVALRGDNIAALLHHLGPLAPGETYRLITQLGQEESIERALPCIQHWRNECNVDQALVDLACFWDGYLARQQIETPDVDMNRMLNIHNPRQCHTTLHWSRYLSLYQLGYGARGIGFRDSSQDVMGVLLHAPQEAKKLLEQLLSVQKRNGSAMHQFNPLTMEANAGDSRERSDLPPYYSDDHLWIVLAVCAYLKESGDLAFLEETVPFYEKNEEGTVLEHLQRAIDFTHNDVGAHGLPLLGFADWNDTVNLKAGAESLFTANLYGKALLELMELARYQGDAVTHDRYHARYEEMKQRVNQHGWDGEWYGGYLDGDGTRWVRTPRTGTDLRETGQSWRLSSDCQPGKRVRRSGTRYTTCLTRPLWHQASVTPGFNGFDHVVAASPLIHRGQGEMGASSLHANPGLSWRGTS